MPLFKRQKKELPFLVVVNHGRYDLYAEDTIENRMIASIIEKEGGISDTVAVGIYEVEFKEVFDDVYLHLKPYLG